MTRLSKAIEKVRALPTERQELAADLLLNLVSGDVFAAHLDDRQVAEVELAKAEADAGDFVSPGDVNALWRKHGA